MKKKFLVAGIFTGLFICLAFLLGVVDVSNNPRTGSNIGFSSINQGVYDTFGTNPVWNKITDVLIAIAVVTAMAFFLFGVAQIVKRRKISKVDYELFALGGLYVTTALLYVLFEKVLIVNYRPILVDDGVMEASFPSTHTLISCVAMWSAAVLLERYIKNIKLRRALQVACAILPIVIGLGRVIAGMHWLTDVLGSMLIGVAMVFAFWGFVNCIDAKVAKSARKAKKH